VRSFFRVDVTECYTTWVSVRRDVALDSSDHGAEKFQKTSRLPLDFRVYNSSPSCSGPFGPFSARSKMVSLASPAPAEPPAVAR
jgi:hypothetical protein